MPRRDNRGRFLKSGSSSSTKRRRSTTATRTIVRSSSAKPIIIRQSAAPAKRSGGKRRRHHGGGGGQIPVKVKGEFAGWASLIGYIKETRASTFEQIPQVGKLPREALLAVGLHVFGKGRPHVDRASVSAACIAGYELGKAQFKMSGWEDDD